MILIHGSRNPVPLDDRAFQALADALTGLVFLVDRKYASRRGVSS